MSLPPIAPASGTLMTSLIQAQPRVAEGSPPPAPIGAQESETMLPASSTAGPTELQQALEDVKSAIGAVSSDLTFAIDQDTGRTLVKIVDRETDEVIKQIPSEEVLRISKALDKLQGLLVKQEA